MKKERYKKKPQGKNIIACPIAQKGHSDTLYKVNVSFRLYGRKLSVIIHYFLSVQTEIYSYISLFSAHRDRN